MADAKPDPKNHSERQLLLSRVRDLDFELSHRGLAPTVHVLSHQVVVRLSIDDAERLTDLVRGGS